MNKLEELNAKYILEEINSKIYSNLKKGDNERPDLMREDKSLGVEVTRIIPNEWAEIDSIINRYLGKGLSYDEVIEYTKDKNMESFIFSINNGKNWGYRKEKNSAFNMNIFLEKIKKEIEKKFKKAKDYSVCKQLDLFVFFDLCLITRRDIEELWKDVCQTWSGFDNIIFFNSSELFFLNKTGEIDTVDLTAEIRKRAFEKAEIEYNIDLM